MQTEIITTKREHYRKLPDGTYELASSEEVEIQRPVGPIMTPQERIEQLETALAALLAAQNNTNV
jgi:hypothetical protein